MPIDNKYLAKMRAMNSGGGSGGGVSVQPDWNQNDATKMDYIKNRPFYEEVTETTAPLDISWDGDTTGKTSYNVSLGNGSTMDLCRVSAAVLSLDDISTGTITLIDDSGAPLTMKLGEDITPESLQDSFGVDGVGVVYMGLPIAVSIPHEMQLMGHSVIEGTYFALVASTYTSNLSNPNAQITVSHEVIRTIDPKYIKDMYYEEAAGRVDVIPERMMVFESAGAMVQEASAVPFEDGKTYYVTWDGVEYECVAVGTTVDEVPIVGIGNMAVIGGEDNGLPFGIAACTDYGFTAYASLTAGEVTFRVEESAAVIHKIDPKYINLGWNEVAQETRKLLYSGTIEADGDAQIGFPILGLLAGDVVEITINGETELANVYKEDGSYQVSIYTASGVAFGYADATSLNTGVVLCSPAGTYEVEITRLSFNKIPPRFLPTSFSSVFDLKELGLPEFNQIDGTVTVSGINTSEIISALTSGAARFKYMAWFKDVGGTMYGRLHNVPVFAHKIDNKTETVYVTVPVNTNNGKIVIDDFAILANGEISATRREVICNYASELFLTSSTEGSTKQFKITVDDSGTLTATEVTN